MGNWFKAFFLTLLIIFWFLFVLSKINESNRSRSPQIVTSSQKENLINTINIASRNTHPQISQIPPVKDVTYIEPSIRKAECESHSGQYAKYIDSFLISKWKTWNFWYKYWMHFSEKIWNCIFFLIDDADVKANISTINFWLFNWNSNEELVHRKYVCWSKECLNKYEEEKQQILNSYR